MPLLQRRFEQLNACVIMPTYNNAKTVARVVDSVLAYTQNLIVVNDGATDGTSEILSRYPGIAVLAHPQNRGKGKALQTGISHATQLGYDYAITIDSDGQHFAEDLAVFLDEIAQNGPALLIGSRDMKGETVPKKSSFGNRFSNFWFWVETGITLSDTQSGYRLYPLKSLPGRYFTTKFEFEIEIIVRAAWKGIPVKNVPVGVLYDPEERVSHFRPFRDFTRISILNTVLVALALLFYLPRLLFWRFKKKGLKKFLTQDLFATSDSRAKKATSVALGVFIGLSPFWGFHTALVIFLAVIFRLNKSIAFVFSNVSLPPFIPFIIYGSLLTGGIFFGEPLSIAFSDGLSISDVGRHIAQYFVGSLTLATVMATVSGILAYAILGQFRTRK